MSITVAWNTAKIAGISREEMDAWALRSHQRAIAAIDEGRFAKEIVPIKVTTSDGSAVVFEVDEHPRRGTSMEKLASPQGPAPRDPGLLDHGRATPRASTTRRRPWCSPRTASPPSTVWHPLATVRSWASVGVNPYETGIAPTVAIPKALGRAGLSVADVALWEINEAFAVVPIAACQILDIDPELVNISGSGCSLGHPIAATGARMVTTLIYDLQRRGGGISVAVAASAWRRSTACAPRRRRHGSAPSGDRGRPPPEAAHPGRHFFANESRPRRYLPESAEKAWTIALGFLAANMAPRGGSHLPS
jgi:acetyl-CoA acetyltransferase